MTGTGVFDAAGRRPEDENKCEAIQARQHFAPLCASAEGLAFVQITNPGLALSSSGLLPLQCIRQSFDKHSESVVFLLSTNINGRQKSFIENMLKSISGQGRTLQIAAGPQ